MNSVSYQDSGSYKNFLFQKEAVDYRIPCVSPLLTLLLISREWWGLMDILEEETVYRVKSSLCKYRLFCLTLLFSNWTSSKQQLTTIYSYTLYTKEVQVWKWLSYLANINVKLQDPSSKDHSLPLHISSDKNYWTWLWNIIRLHRQFPRFPFRFCIQETMTHDFNF